MWLTLGIVFYVIFAAADAYTTKRALLDPYRGAALRLKEGNRAARWLQEKIGFWPAMILPKAAVLALAAGLAVDPSTHGVGALIIWVFAVAQGFVAWKNRRLIMKARSRIPFAILLLSSSLANASWLYTQEWSWDEVTRNAANDPITVPTYRIYESRYPDCFQVGDYTEVSALLACDDATCDPPRCCADPPEPLDTTFYFWVAVSSAGVESTWPTSRRKELTCP